MTHTIRAILLDMDGVLYHGEQAIPGAIEFMRAIADTPHAFITNNPISPPGAVADRLARLGFNRPDPGLIVTSAEATAQWLHEQKKSFRYFAVGAAGLHQALSKFGTADNLQADFVVIGEGAGIDYKQISTGVNLILQHQAQLICTNPDHSVDGFIDGKHCVLPGGGALVAPFAITAETEPVFIGKPHSRLYQIALERLGVAAEHSLMIGDRPDTDIAGATALGMKTALVRTGRFAANAALPQDLPAPDFDTDSLLSLLPALLASDIL